MITDQKQASVPNGNAFSMPTRQRTQLVKPNQMNNAGRSANIDSRGGPAGTFQNAAPQFNPLRPANAAAQVTPRQMPAQQRQPAQPQIQMSKSEPVGQAAPIQVPTVPTPQPQPTMSQIPEGLARGATKQTPEARSAR